MQALSDLMGQLNSIVWGPPMLVLILGVGLFLMIALVLLSPILVSVTRDHFSQ